MVVFYFGCWKTTRHALYDEDGFVRARVVLPWHQAEIDGRLCEDTAEQVEGRAKVRHRDGWTLLTFWDRSLDRRMWSNSSLIAKGTFNAAQMIVLLRSRFPSIVARFKFEIVPITEER